MKLFPRSRVIRWLTRILTYLKSSFILSNTRFFLIDTNDRKALWSLIHHNELGDWFRVYTRILQVLLIERNRSFPSNLFYYKGESVIAFAFLLRSSDEMFFIRRWDGRNKISIRLSLKRTIFVTSIFRIKWNIILFFGKLCVQKWTKHRWY